MLTGEGLLAFARSKIGTPYVYGMKGAVMTQAKYDALKKAYGSMVWDSDRKKVGKVCVDCSGLISWYTGIVLGSAQLKQRAKEVNSIGTIKNAPVGALVWRSGHVGVYAGCKNGVPYYVAADGSAYGVREVPLSCNAFTHWLLMKDITYSAEGEEEVVETAKIKVNGKYYEVERILKNGTNYIKVRDLAKAGFEISNEGNIAVINTK